MTRDEILAIIAGGGSVAWQGRILAHPEDVPPDTVLAAIPDQRLVSLESLDAQIAALEAERAALAAEQPTVTGKVTKGKA